jgi:hypothetical protein
MKLRCAVGEIFPPQILKEKSRTGTDLLVDSSPLEKTD